MGKSIFIEFTLLVVRKKQVVSLPVCASVWELETFSNIMVLKCSYCVVTTAFVVPVSNCGVEEGVKRKILRSV